MMKKSTSRIHEVQKKYRRYEFLPNRLESWDEMIDFSSPNVYVDKRISKIDLDLLQGDYQGPIFGVKAYPGFLYAPSALDIDLQKGLALAALSCYCEPPHVTNIDAFSPKPCEEISHTTMWNIWKCEHYNDGSVSVYTDGSSTRPATTTTHQYYRSFRKLSWATLGYHYDWTARAYNKEYQSDMPQALIRLGKLFAETALRIETLENTQSLAVLKSESSNIEVSFQATACIINYYNEKSVMGPHRDDLEEAVGKPVVSFSMGRPAIFLLGGSSLDAEPIVPILVRPGDVMIIGGVSRLNYHCMARLLPEEFGSGTTSGYMGDCLHSQNQVKLEHCFQSDAIKMGEFEQKALKMFLSNHRININLRQVYKETNK